MMNIDTAPNKRRFPSVYAGTTAPLKKTLDHHHNVAVSKFSSNNTTDELTYYKNTASILFEYFQITGGHHQHSDNQGVNINGVGGENPDFDKTGDGNCTLVGEHNCNTFRAEQSASSIDHSPKSTIDTVDTVYTGASPADIISNISQTNSNATDTCPNGKKQKKKSKNNASAITISQSAMIRDKPNSIIRYFMNTHHPATEQDTGQNHDNDGNDHPSSSSVNNQNILPDSNDSSINKTDEHHDSIPDEHISSLADMMAESIIKPCVDKPIQFLADDRASLLEKYMCRTAPSYVKNATILQSTATSKLDDNALSMCGHCGSTDRTTLNHDGMIICNACASVEYVVIDHERPSYKEPPKEISYFAYKRINHLNEWISQSQGLETTEIPEELYDKIFIEIKKRKITNLAELTHAQLRSIIRKLGANKYFEHQAHIMYRINGIPVPHLSKDLEDKIRYMFKQIQAPFLKYSPPNRKNFLSYAYTIHKMLQLLEKDEYLSYFPLLKSREKLQAQDKIWKNICADNGWQFIRSI